MFHCDKCGECCRNLQLSSVYAELDRGDGICIHLDGNLCRIYDRRPLICRVDESYEAFFAQSMSKEQYEQLNYESCKLLKQRRKI